MHISVDAECYRSKREESLTRLAEKMAEKAIKYKRSMALEPMNSYERHVIHTALQKLQRRYHQFHRRGAQPPGSGILCEAGTAG